MCINMDNKRSDWLKKDIKLIDNGKKGNSLFLGLGNTYALLLFNGQ